MDGIYLTTYWFLDCTPGLYCLVCSVQALYQANFFLFIFFKNRYILMYKMMGHRNGTNSSHEIASLALIQSSEGFSISMYRVVRTGPRGYRYVDRPLLSDTNVLIGTKAYRAVLRCTDQYRGISTGIVPDFDCYQGVSVSTPWRDR